MVCLVETFESIDSIWAVRGEHAHGDWKRNAGAGTLVARRRVSVGWGTPLFIQTNARVGYLNVDAVRLYFFPDRLLVFDSRGISAVCYADLSLVDGTVQFVEEGGVPRDATVVRTTWRFVNKSSAPRSAF